MIRKTLGFLSGIVLLLPVQSAAADQDCSSQVQAAFAKQRALGVFEMKTTMINATGVTNMVVEYKLPGRMRQKVKRVTEPVGSETILVDNKAWSRQGGKWNEVPNAYVEQLTKQLQETVVSPPRDESHYVCAGKKVIDGKELLKFQGFETIRTPKKEGSNEVKLKVTKRDGAPIRFVYVDPSNGLPVRNTVATATRPDQPFFKSVFAYPSDIKISAPETGVTGGK